MPLNRMCVSKGTQQNSSVSDEQLGDTYELECEEGDNGVVGAGHCHFVPSLYPWPLWPWRGAGQDPHPSPEATVTIYPLARLNSNLSLRSKSSRLPANSCRFSSRSFPSGWSEVRGGTPPLTLGSRGRLG